MNLFYAPGLPDCTVLPEDEAKHCIQVLRAQNGDTIHLTDGQGNFYNAVIVQAHPKHCKFEIIETIPTPLPWKYLLQIDMAPTKNMERTEWFVEKATETGINTIGFIQCQHSERKELKISRIEKVAIAAMKQTLKASFPAIQEIQPFKVAINQPFEGQQFIAHCHPDIERTELSRIYRKGSNARILIGPEGDFSSEEIDAALEAGFQSISLGPCRLRTETAALIACQTIHIINSL